MIRWAMTGTCKKLTDVPPGAKVTEVNDREVIGYCVGCGKHILEGSDFVWYSEDMACKKCGKVDEEVERAWMEVKA